MTRDDVVRIARSQLGVRWLHQASLKDVACDCLGLVSIVGSEMRVKEAFLWARDARRMSYGREPLLSVLKAALNDYLDKKDFPFLAGDILEMIPPGGRVPMHFGIASSPTAMIHAYAPARRVVEHTIDREWQSRIVGVYCFKGL